MIKCCPDIILNSKCYSHLINTLLLILLNFRSDNQIRIEIYVAIYSLIYSKISPKENSNKTDMKQWKHNKEDKIEGLFSTEHNDLTKDLLQNNLLNEILTHLPGELEMESSLSEEQKIIYQIFRMIRIIDLKNPEIHSVYNYKDELLAIEYSMMMLQERNNYDIVSYL